MSQDRLRSGHIQASLRVGIDARSYVSPYLLLDVGRRPREAALLGALASLEFVKTLDEIFKFRG